MPFLDQSSRELHHAAHHTQQQGCLVVCCACLLLKCTQPQMIAVGGQSAFQCRLWTESMASCPCCVQALVTLADLAAWEAATRSDVTKTMAKLYARLQACIAGLQQQLAAELAAREKAAAAHVQVGSSASWCGHTSEHWLLCCRPSVSLNPVQTIGVLPSF